MKYHREFTVQAVHFNGAAAYANYRQANEYKEAGEYALACNHLRQCLADVHGHNFKITIEIEGDTLDDQSFLVDDYALAAMVDSWGNKNLSILDEFAGKRATTEQMALVLCRKLLAVWPQLRFVVTVWETPLISATCNSRDVFGSSQC